MTGRISLFMGLNHFLWAMGLGTLLAAIAWTLVLFRVDPDEAGMVGHILFYLTLFAASTGFWSVVGTLYRVRFRKGDHLTSRAVKISVRHAIMLSAVGVTCLAFSAFGWLRWWNVLLQFFVVAAIEYVFLLVQENQRT